MILRADRDKPHRCPNCWAVLTNGNRFRKWKLYHCKGPDGCGVRFAWWGWPKP